MPTKEEMLEIMQKATKKNNSESREPKGISEKPSIEQETLAVLYEIRNGILELRRIFLGEGV